MICPFCKEDDFDLIGLKSHLTGEGLMFAEGCQVFKDIPTVNNPCDQCEYRKPGEQEYINICLLDELEDCVRKKWMVI